MLFFDDIESGEEMWFCGENVGVSPALKPTEKKSTCACGRSVCCGKHKDCCHKKETIRFVKGAQRER